MSKLICVFAFRHDANLVPDLMANLESFVDDFIFFDDSCRQSGYYHEGNVRNHLVSQAVKKGADWILGIDPDERIENRAGPLIRQLIQSVTPTLYGFAFRELYSPTEYRVDGIWGHKKRWSLFPVLPNQTFMNTPLHSFWWPTNTDYRRVLLDLNIYHFKMIDPANRTARRKLYNTIDPLKQWQPTGYDYLTDESTLQLETVPEGREYYPPYNPDYKITVPST